MDRMCTVELYENIVYKKYDDKLKPAFPGFDKEQMNITPIFLLMWYEEAFKSIVQKGIKRLKW